MRTNDEMMSDFFHVMMRLEPENLYMDGEATKADVARTTKACKAEWKALEKEIGHKVTEDQVWQWESTRRGSF